MTQAFALKNGAYFILTEAPGGIYNAEQLRTIATLCEQDSAIVKATEDQRIGMFISPDNMEQITGSLQKVGLSVRHYQNGLQGAIACLGEVCPKEEQDALGLAMELQESFSGLGGSLGSCLKIGINGCSNCCVPSHTLDVALIGEENGYRISLGGKSSQIAELASYAAEGVPADKVAPLVREIIKIYEENREEGETFHENIERVGIGDYLETLKPYSADALGGDMPFDVGIREQSPPSQEGGEIADLEVGIDETKAENIPDPFAEEPDIESLMDVSGDDALDMLEESPQQVDSDDSLLAGMDDAASDEMASLDSSIGNEVDNFKELDADTSSSLSDVAAFSDLKDDSLMEEILIDDPSDSLSEDILMEEDGLAEASPQEITEDYETKGLEAMIEPSLENIPESMNTENIDLGGSDEITLSENLIEEDSVKCSADDPIDPEDEVDLNFDELKQEDGADLSVEGLMEEGTSDLSDVGLMEEDTSDLSVEGLMEEREDVLGSESLVDGGETEMESHEDLNKLEDGLLDEELSSVSELVEEKDAGVLASSSAADASAELTPQSGAGGDEEVEDAESLELSEEEADIFESRLNDEITIVAQIPHGDDLASSERESALRSLENEIGANSGGNEESPTPETQNLGTAAKPSQDLQGQKDEKLTKGEKGERSAASSGHKKGTLIVGCSRTDEGIVVVQFSGGISYKFDPHAIEEGVPQKININKCPLILTRTPESIDIQYGANLLTIDVFPDEIRDAA